MRPENTINRDMNHMTTEGEPMDTVTTLASDSSNIQHSTSSELREGSGQYGLKGQKSLHQEMRPEFCLEEQIELEQQHRG